MGRNKVLTNYKAENYHFVKLYESDLLDKSVEFLNHNLKDWEVFSKNTLEFYKEFKKTKNIRIRILVTTLLIEKLLDFILIRFYNMNIHHKYEPYKFLEKITLRNKIQIVKDIKASYPHPRPEENKYKPLINLTSNVEGWKRLKAKYGEKIFKEIDEMNKEYDVEKGITEPNWARLFLYPKDDDYLDDDMFKLLSRTNINELHEIDDYRNMVAHYLNIREAIQKTKKTEKEIIKKCENVISSLIGLKFKK